MVHVGSIVGAIDCAVADLDNLSDDDEQLFSIGVSHVSRGVKPRDIRVMVCCILYAMEEKLKQEFTMELRKLWLVVLGRMVESMIKGLKAGPSFEERTGAYNKDRMQCL
nr:hypothetical protein BaRGS_010373 [Batillaria attramentaria]